MGLVFSLHASSKKECALWFSYFFVQTCFRIDKHTHLSSSCVYGNRLHFTVNMVLCILVYIYICSTELLRLAIYRVFVF